MPVKTKIQSFSTSYQIVVDGSLSKESQQKAVAKFARAKIAEGDAINQKALGRVPPKTVTVDGRRDAELETVNPDRGIIIAEWRLVEDVLIWIYKTLQERSPVLSGEYKKSHKFYADNSEANPARPPLASEYIFLNPVPYSRKLDMGKTKSGRDFLVSVPNRIYARTAKDAKAKFGNLAQIRFSYRAAVGGSIVNKNRDSRVPAIVVTIR
jgi:hypothetical protein